MDFCFAKVVLAICRRMRGKQGHGWEAVAVALMRAWWLVTLRPPPPHPLAPPPEGLEMEMPWTGAGICLYRQRQHILVMLCPQSFVSVQGHRIASSKNLS